MKVQRTAFFLDTKWQRKNILYKEIRMDPFAFFSMLTATWTSTICWKCCLFFPLECFLTFLKNQVTIGVWVHFWVFSPIPLFYLPVTVPITCSFYPDWSVVQLEVADGASPRSSFIVENILVFWFSKWICKWLLLTLWRIELEFWWGLDWICRLLLARWPVLLY